MNPGSLSMEETEEIRCYKLRMRLAQEAHLQARQRLDLRRDLAAKLLPSHGPLEVNEAVWYWARDMSKIRGGHWLKAKILSTEYDSPMVKIQLQECSPDHVRRFWVNRSLIRKNPDPWHDVPIPGLDGETTGTQLPRAPFIYLEEDEYGEPVPTGDDRPDDVDPNEDFIDRSNEEFEREVAEKLSLDLEKPSRPRRKKDPDPEDQDEINEIFGEENYTLI